MPAAWLVLSVLATASMGASILVAREVWPRLRNFERQGFLKKPVPDLLEGDTNTVRAWTLMWATTLPADRPRLKRLIMAFRALQILGIVLMLAAMVLMGA